MQGNFKKLALAFCRAHDIAPKNPTQELLDVLHAAADIAWTDPAGVKLEKTSFQAAPFTPDLGVVAWLIAKGADVNARDPADERNVTPLMWAARGGNAALATLLLELGADLTAATYLGSSAMYEAVRHKHAAVADVLATAGYDVTDSKDLWWTCAFGPPEAVEVLLRHGADANHKGGQPLNASACEADVDTARLLLSHGARMDVKDDDGITPLMRAIHTDKSMEWKDTEAASRKRADYVEFLIAHGADFTAPQGNGYTPLMLAAKMGAIGPARVLLAHGAAPDAVNDKGETALSLLQKALLDHSWEMQRPIPTTWSPKTLRDEPLTSKIAQRKALQAALTDMSRLFEERQAFKASVASGRQLDVATHDVIALSPVIRPKTAFSRQGQ